MRLQTITACFFLVGATWGQAPATAPTAATPATTAAPDETAKLKKSYEDAKKILQDWPNLARYAAENTALAPPANGENRVVFMGDSITDGWNKKGGRFFPGKTYVDRGISGQTTPQMLIRFRPDVLALKPKVVVILAGTNDLAGNTGPMTVQATEDNLQSMAELAKANGIQVVLSSIMPVSDYSRPQTARHPKDRILAINGWMESFADRNGFVYLDYYTPMLDDKGWFKQELSGDGLHPNDEGYALMAPLAQQAIDKALKAH